MKNDGWGEKILLCVKVDGCGGFYLYMVLGWVLYTGKVMWKVGWHVFSKSVHVLRSPHAGVACIEVALFSDTSVFVVLT